MTVPCHGQGCSAPAGSQGAGSKPGAPPRSPHRVSSQPALVLKPMSRCKSQRAAAAQRGAGPATAVTVNYKVLEPRAGEPLAQQQSR